MKKLKKFMSLLCAAMMLFTMEISTFAAETEVVISDASILDEHTFTAYQIFTGTQTGNEDDPALGDIAWGSGIDAQSLMDALNETDSPLKDEFNIIDHSNEEKLAKAAKKVAEILESWSQASGKAENFAEIVYEHIMGNGVSITENTTSLEEGYYLIVDSTSSVEEGSAYNAALLQVTGNTIRINVKTDAPSIEKKVGENTKYNASDESSVIKGVIYGEGFNDVADYCIGDSVPFAFYSKVPDMKYYDTYRFEMHDILGTGLTLIDEESDGFSVTIGTKSLTRGKEYTVEKSGQSFVIKIADLKAISGINVGDVIKVNYAAKLNSNAIAGSGGNTNQVYLKYSNHPNDDNSMGQTPTDQVVVFTYELDVMKVDGNSLNEGAYETKLADAEFVLYRTIADKTEYVVLNTDGKVEGWSETKPETGNLKSAADGTFKIIGLDDGIYFLEETKAPLGYNLLTSPIELVILADTSNGQNGADGEMLTNLNISVNINPEDYHNDSTNAGNIITGAVNVIVENNKGAVLPSTGGSGTVGLYISGAFLMTVALIILVFRKRPRVHNNQ